MNFPDDSVGKEFFLCLQCITRRRCRFSPWVGKMPWRSMGTHLGIFAWKILWTEEPCGLQSISSVQFSRSVVSNPLRPHESQHARPPCPSPTPRVYSNSCPSSWWCHSAISSSVVPFSSCPQSLPASGSFPISQLFVWSGQSIGVSGSASVLPMNTQDWSLLGWTGKSPS